MARIRSVHPDLHRDKTLSEASASAERTFVRLWCHLDDDGRGEDDLDMLKADLYPRHRHVNQQDIDDDLEELAKLELIVRYEVDGEWYLACKPTTWAKYQRPQKKKESELPGPEDSRATTRPLRDQSDSSISDSVDTATRPLPPVGEGRGEECRGEEGRGEEGSTPVGGDESPFFVRLASKLQNEHGCEFPERDTRYEAFHDLLTAALARLPSEQHRGTTMGLVADFVRETQGIPISKESRSHTASLVGNHRAVDVLFGFGQALEWGAGTTAEYADDPLALSRYVAGVLSKKVGAT